MDRMLSQISNVPGSVRKKKIPFKENFVLLIFL